MMLRLREGVHRADTRDGSMVLLDERSDRYHQLSPSGALVARLLLDHGHTVTSAVRVLTQRYEVFEDTATADVARLVAGLRAARLVVQTP